MCCVASKLTIPVYLQIDMCHLFLQRAVTDLEDNNLDDTYMYLVSTVTGFWQNAGTTSRVYIYLDGSTDRVHVTDRDMLFLSSLHMCVLCLIGLYIMCLINGLCVLFIINGLYVLHIINGLCVLYFIKVLCVLHIKHSLKNKTIMIFSILFTVRK